MIYSKNITRKMNKYIHDKNKRKYKKLEITIFKNTTSRNLLKKYYKLMKNYF